MHQLNSTLMDVAAWKARGDAEKRAFVPADAAAAAAGGGAPPMDPAAMGGAPPMDPMAMGGAPPMDPMAMGGAPPMDPAMMGGAPPMAPPMAPPAAPPAAGAAPGAGAAAKPKIDPTFIYMELSRIRKLQTHMMQQTGIDLPPDILDDGAVAQQLNGTPPESQALGQEPAPPAPPAGGAMGGGMPGIGESPAINPIEAPGGAMGGAMGGEKQGNLLQTLFQTNGPLVQKQADDDGFDSLNKKLDALAAIARSRKASQQ